MRRVITFALLAVTAACASPAPRSSFAPRDSKHDEILLYDQDIRRWRTELKLSLNPDEHKIRMFHHQPVQKPPEPVANIGEVCLDVCDLATRICEAQEHICKIAGELGPEDEWAAQKCDSAKASCKEAKDRCTDCLEQDGTR